MALEVKCISKENRSDPHNRITHIGGVKSDGNRWRITEEQAIQYIESGQYSFYVTVNWRKVNVIIETRNGRKYLKTEADGIIPNNLLSLPEC